MILSAEHVVVGFMDGVEGVCWIINKGTPTEQIIAIPVFVALDASAETVRRASILIKKSGNLSSPVADDAPTGIELQ